MEDTRICRGYQIIDSIRVGTTEVVLAHNPDAVLPYVTWKSYAHSNFQDFELGRYFEDEASARRSLYTRARSVLDMLLPDSPSKRAARGKDHDQIR